jgi:hypothetical protein
MKTFITSFKLIAATMLTLAAFTACESTDGGGGNVSGGIYYGVGFNDPWYYGGYYDDPDIIVTPPDSNPGRPGSGPRPEHPIASPPPAASPRPMPMPSIPSTPRASFRGGGGRR